MNFAVLASGRGGNLKAIIDAVKSGKIKAHLRVVISDQKDAYALEHARQAGIPAIFINPKDFNDRPSFDCAVVERLHEFKVDFIVLAGYMRLLTGFFLKQFPDKVLNIHPSLLPAFKGTHAIKDAFNGGVKVTGVTVHFVVEEMDSGAIILQEPVRIEHHDSLETLETKIHQVEHRIYPQAIELFVSGKIKIQGIKTTGL